MTKKKLAKYVSLEMTPKGLSNRRTFCPLDYTRNSMAVAEKTNFTQKKRGTFRIAGAAFLIKHDKSK